MPLAKLFKFSRRHHWGRHQLLFRADDPATALYRVTSGVLAVSIAMPDARRQIVVFLFPGDICGLVQSNGRYAFDCEAIGDATTHAVGMRHVCKLTISDPDIAEALKKDMSRTDTRIADQIVAVGQLHAKERILYFLRRLSQSYAERGMPTHPLPLPMTRRDMADHLGMRLETLSRALAELKRRQLIDFHDSNTVVLNSEAVGRVLA
jgi:CRP/FNR family transcriptional regulator